MFFLLCLSLLLLCISPLVSAVSAMFIMFVFGGGFKKEETLFFSILAMLSVIFIISSRGILPVTSGIHDDINVYYSVYEDILREKFDALFTFGGGVEVGLPLYFYFVSCIFGDVTKNQLIFLVNLPVGIFFIYWVYKNSQKICQVKHLSFLISGVLIFYSFGYGSLLLRQYCACVFLLYAFTEKRNYIVFLLVALAIFFHTSSLFVFFIVTFFLKKNITLMGTLAAVVSLCLAIFFAVQSFDVDIITRNLSYYSDGGSGSNAITARTTNDFTFKILLLATIIIMASEFISAAIRYKSIQFSRYSLYIISMLIVTILTMDYAWLPTRVFLIPVYFLLPIIIFISMGEDKFKFFQVFITFIFLFRIKSWFFSSDSLDSIWVGYSWYGPPFYYLFSLQ